MKISMEWLKEFVDIKESAAQVAEDMTMGGQKVETVEYIGEKLENIVVGRVNEIKRHENSDKLFITQTEIGGGKVLQIVTGADNLKQGDYVPVALDGAVLCDGKVIRRGVLRGEESNGMLCSISELGFSAQEYPECVEDGIYVFPEPQALGADAREVMKLKAEVIEFEVTSNRPDCFSVIGLAREAAAVYGRKLRHDMPIPAEKGEGRAGDMISVEIKNPELCSRYAARVLRNVKIGPSPLWMRHRLICAGLRPINNIVDITNYVMLELGQPLHAFDIDSISGGIIVRSAGDGEEFTTLDGERRTLDSSMLVIADHEKAVAIAGVMGGENSKITGGASAVLLESANFDGVNIRMTSKKLGLRTDATAKFEKGIDPELALEAVNRAAALVEELGCGEVVPGIVDNYPNKRAERTVKLEPEKINALLGTNLTSERMAEILALLELRVQGGGVVVPTFRPDINVWQDLAEEVARIYGFNNITPTLPKGRPTAGKKTSRQLFDDKLRQIMVGCGLSEAMSFAYEGPKVFDKLLLPGDSPMRDTVKIINPLGEDYSIMRTMCENAMLASLATNYSRRHPEAALFELSKRYLPKALPLTELPDEVQTLVVGMYGKTDFYAAKGIVEELAAKLFVNVWFLPEKDLPFMHSGRTAGVMLDGKRIGYVGEVHPEVRDNYRINERVYLAALELEPLFAASDKIQAYEPIARFPKVRRDIALIVDDGVLAMDVERVISASGGELLESVKVFDVYKADKDSGTKSMAYNMVFGLPDRTLRDEEVSESVAKITHALEKELAARIRDK